MRVVILLDSLSGAVGLGDLAPANRRLPGLVRRRFGEAADDAVDFLRLHRRVAPAGRHWGVAGAVGRVSAAQAAAEAEAGLVGLADRPAAGVSGERVDRRRRTNLEGGARRIGDLFTGRAGRLGSPNPAGGGANPGGGAPAHRPGRRVSPGDAEAVNLADDGAAGNAAQLPGDLA